VPYYSPVPVFSKQQATNKTKLLSYSVGSIDFSYQMAIEKLNFGVLVPFVYQTLVRIEDLLWIKIRVSSDKYLGIFFKILDLVIKKHFIFKFASLSDRNNRGRASFYGLAFIIKSDKDQKLQISPLIFLDRKQSMI
jgi:hypothetical protein